MKKVCKHGLFVLLLAMVFTAFAPTVLPNNYGMGSVEAATVKLNKTKLTLEIGETAKLKVKGTSKKVTWSSSKKSVASVNKNGKVTGKKKGTATITAKVGKKKYTCKVKVVTPATPNVSIKPMTTVSSSTAKNSFKIKVKNNDTRTIEFSQCLLAHNYEKVYSWGKLSNYLSYSSVAILMGQIDEDTDEAPIITIKPGKTKTITIKDSTYSITGSDKTYFVLLMDVNDNRFIYDLYPNTGKGSFEK